MQYYDGIILVIQVPSVLEKLQKKEEMFRPFLPVPTTWRFRCILIFLLHNSCNPNMSLLSTPM